MQRAFVLRPQSFILILILLFAFLTRIYRLSEPKKYIFDEVYHAVTAKLIAHNDPRAFEWWNPEPEPHTAVDWLHPPLAKYTQALGMKIVGFNSFGWRLSSAIFGVGVIFLTFKLAQGLFHQENLSLLAAFLASLDGLLLVQSRIAMNDIHVTFFILLTLVFYLKYRHNFQLKYLFLTGLSAGLAMASKWSGVFALAIVWISEISRQILNFKFNKTFNFSLLFFNFLQLFGYLIILPLAIYVLSYTQMFLQGKDLTHFYHLHQQIWWYQTRLNATHPYQSRPWQWWLNLRPVWYDVVYPDQKQVANIYAFGNPALFWWGDVAVIISIMTVISSLSRNPSRPHLSKFSSQFFVLSAYFAVWLPWQISPRIMFFYHYTPAVPLLSIILANFILSSHKKLLPTICLLSIIICFIIWYPHWTEMTIPTSWANQIYFSLVSWK